MIDISKHRRTIAACGAIAALSVLAAAQSASAQATNSSNATGGNNTGNPAPPITPPPSTPGLAPGITSRASAINSNVADSYQSFIQSRAKVQQLTVPTTPEVKSPQRFSRVADAADCGCPNADTVGSTPTAPASTPELEAAKAAEAAAAEKLAAAKAEARQFIEDINKGNTGSTSVSVIW